VAVIADKVVVELDLAMEQFIRDGKKGEAAFAATLDKMLADGRVTEQQLKQHFKGIADGLGEIPDKAGKHGADAGDLFARNFITRVTAGILSGALLAAMVQTAKQLGEIEDTARRSGIEIGKFQELLYAGRVNGVSESAAVKDIQKITDLLADAANNPRNSLRRLFEVNGIRIDGKTPEQAISDLSRLMQNAPENLKGKIADLAGFSREWIQLLEQGPEAMQAIMAKANEAGAVLDKIGFEKAAEFRKAWNEATTRWADLARNAIVELLPLLDTLVTKALEFTNYLAKTGNNIVNQAVAASAVLQADLTGSVAALEALTDKQLELARLVAQGPLGSADSLARVERVQQERLNAPASPVVTIRRGTTRLPDPYRRENDKDPAEASLRKKIALLEAEAASLGKTRFEQDATRAATELYNAAIEAGIKPSQELTDHTRRLGEQYAVAAERARLAKDQFQAANELMRSFGNAAIDGIDGLISKTKSLNDVLASTLRTFAKMAAQAALLGDGPLATFFGTKSTTGGVGGLFGGIGGGIASLFGISGFREGGGPVNAGQSYVVGEKRAEVFTPNVAGYISPSVQGGRSGPSVTNYNDFRDASANAIPAIAARIAMLERNFPNMVAPALRNERRTNPWAV